MLFDLRGKRKRVIQVVYLLLAVLFGASLILLGAGSGISGGLLDAFHGGGSTDSAFEQPIKDAKQRTEQSPRSAAAWLDLAQTELALANSAEGFDQDTGGPNDKGQQAAVDGTEAWQRYLKLLQDSRRPDPGVAQLAANGYANIGDAQGALRAQQIVVDERPSATAWSQLALFAYASGHNKLGDEAQAKAIALVPRDQRNTIRSTLKDQEKQGKKFYRARRKAERQAKKQGTGAGQAGQSFGPLPGQGTGLGQ